jgi:hypothetical protein
VGELFRPVDCGQQSSVSPFDEVDIVSVLGEIPIDGVDIRSISKCLGVHVTDRLLTHH